ncbi:hypothetical protein AB1N83_006988, partial [Pleurotus pulmonarius]
RPSARQRVPSRSLRGRSVG